ncbi:uncharacterized protein Nmag_1210 [Natrialba magadii ATCC 43099]|uniref:Uncharacterized protein n=1 Tax=Natrialba magadii (strain ATCC 43099 / DSM 3394 / CCM 3739 / CIP 104546 / IAM 13178 / JCM 8861 / NBRC 102185 / NCIMB 2190 / MS3) TaxID=547559 RepID=D3SS66_NATMM|nr:hypothetical protein [Natrialba magadii]ADD04792.1 uncharacterized protein Nmag_1210 [Natrialba magadii ATCC 43099]ELY24958.1 hypothetical protein C500_18568 [Natrialba magadii ATCC 43099]
MDPDSDTDSPPPLSFGSLADLPLTIERVSTARLSRDTSSGFTRVTTEITLAGNGLEGIGEDVTYETEDHDELAAYGLPDLTGEFTLESFSNRLADLDLFPTAPDREVFRNYRRWGLESAALDLALRQSDTKLAAELGRERDPVRFVTSMRLGEPPTTDRLESLREQVPEIEFKLDPTTDWDESLIARFEESDTVGTDLIRILDLKGQYEGTDVDTPADPELYELALESFPDALVEDPGLTDETEPLFEDEAVRERVSWDAPIESLADVKELPWEPDWLNIKPSRFGSVASVLETIAYCEERGIQMYGGGQFELGVGRGHIQLLASLFYPDTPNDVAPGAYNDPDVDGELPMSPLEPPAASAGFRW